MDKTKIKELKRIKGSWGNWQAAIKQKGFVDYSFEQLCKVLGYEEAKIAVWGYWINDKYSFCKLVKDFCEIHSSGGYEIKVKMVSDSYIHSFIVKTDDKGEMDQRDGFTSLKAFIAAKEKEFTVSTWVRHQTKVLVRKKKKWKKIKSTNRNV